MSLQKFSTRADFNRISGALNFHPTYDVVKLVVMGVVPPDSLLVNKAKATVQEALERSRTADVRRWAEETLGVTLFSKRRLAFASATNTG